MSIQDVQSLVESEAELETERLVEILRPYVRITASDTQLRFTEDYRGLSVPKRILITLLAQKARTEVNSSEEDTLDPVEIADLSGLRIGVAYPHIRDLERHELVENLDGEYRVPDSKVGGVQQFLGSHRDSHAK